MSTPEPTRGPFEVSLELSEELLKHTPEGAYINVDDLRRAVEKKHAEVAPGTPKYTSFAMARQAAMKDPELRAAFERQREGSPDVVEDVKRREE